LAIRIAYSWDRLLGYIKGGVAWERDEYWAHQTVLGNAYKSTDTRPGWTIGVGAEYQFGSALSGLVEYGYYDFGNRTVAFAPQVSGLPTAFLDITQRASVVRLGINYRFGS
jgi:outer membrane immunogenic protein